MMNKHRKNQEKALLDMEKVSMELDKRLERASSNKDRHYKLMADRSARLRESTSSPFGHADDDKGSPAQSWKGSTFA